METTNWNKLSVKPSEVDILVYHDDCVDGFGCVVAAEYYIENTKSKRPILYIPAKYNQELNIDMDDKNVIFCDFSFKKQKMEEIMKIAKNILVLDHHKTAISELEHMSDCNKVLDVNHSGAYITWVYFNGADNVPLLLQYIQDNDIWKKNMSHTEEISSYLAHIPKNIQHYYPLLNNKILLAKIKIGTEILDSETRDINKILKDCYTKKFTINKKIYTAAVLYCPIRKYKSKLGSMMLSMFAQCDFSIIYDYDELCGKTYTSLRSENSRTDVSEIAVLYGGGGHRNAAGVCFNGAVANGLYEL